MSVIPQIPRASGGLSPHGPPTRALPWTRWGHSAVPRPLAYSRPPNHKSWIRPWLRYDSEDFIFRAIRYFKSKNVYKVINVNRSLSYTRARELLINCLTELGLDSSKFCLHSLRSGGTTAAAANNISDRLIKEHGR